MGANSTDTLVNKSVGWSVGISVLLIIAGLLAIAVPWVAGIAISTLIGWVLILSAAGHLLFAFHTRTFGGVLWEVLLAILYFFVGGYLLFRPVAGLATVTLMLAAYLLAEGVLELILSFQIRSRRGWVWLLFDGIVTLVLALLIWRMWPSDSEWALGTLVGISMLFSGLSRLILSATSRDYQPRS